MSFKANVIAVSTVSLTTKPGKPKTADSAAVKPTVVEKKPGQSFTLTDAGLYKSLKARRAIVDEKDRETLPASIRYAYAPRPDAEPTNASAASAQDEDPAAGKAKPFNKMTHAELDEALKASGKDTPEGWSDFKTAEKASWLTENTAPSGDGNELV